MPTLFSFHLRMLFAIFGFERPLGKTEFKEFPKKLLREALRLQRAVVLKLDDLKLGAMEM